MRTEAWVRACIIILQPQFCSFYSEIVHAPPRIISPQQCNALTWSVALTVVLPACQRNSRIAARFAGTMTSCRDRQLAPAADLSRCPEDCHSALVQGRVVFVAQPTPAAVYLPAAAPDSVCLCNQTDVTVCVIQTVLQYVNVFLHNVFAWTRWYHSSGCFKVELQSNIRACSLQYFPRIFSNLNYCPLTYLNALTQLWI